MLQIALIGIAAGSASALLFASIASGSLLSVPLFYLSPLPILIAALGWSHMAGLVAAVIAASALALILGNFFFISFLVGIGLPAWWLGYLAMLARPGGEGSSSLEWYPVGRLVTWAALISTTIVVLLIFTVAGDEQTLRESLRRSFEPLMRGAAQAPPDASGSAFVRMLTQNPERILPPAAGVVGTLITTFTLWLSARVVRISGRLTRPWPDIAAMTFPPFTLPLLAVSLVGAFILSGLPGVIATVLAASLLAAYGLLGLAVLHAVTRPISGRGFVLSAVYCAIVVFSWPLLLMAMLGIADMALDLRGRAMRRGGPPARPPQ